MKASKLMFKPYHLVNEKTGEKITVHPPRLPGVNGDPQDKKKTPEGEWIRKFDIVDMHGVQAFQGQTFIIMNHMPKMVPSIVVNGERWTIRVIEKEPKVKTKKVSFLDQAKAEISNA